TEVLTEEEGKEVCYHLASPRTIDSLAMPDVAVPLGRIALNPKQPKAVRGNALRMLISAMKQKKASGDCSVFEILVGVIKHDSDDVLRFQAAQGFTGPYTPAQLA